MSHFDIFVQFVIGGVDEMSHQFDMFLQLAIGGLKFT